MLHNDAGPVIGRLCPGCAAETQKPRPAGGLTGLGLRLKGAYVLAFALDAVLQAVLFTCNLGAVADQEAG